jgi:ribosomal protein S14
MSMDGARASRRSAGARKAAANRSDRKCPRCLRKGGLGGPVDLQGRDEPYVGFVRKCRWCGHEVGVANHESFGRDVTPEPGARAS